MRILSIDGGGIRGIIPGILLAEIEKRLIIKTNNEQSRLSDYFDLIAGTSTGGILTCVLICPDKDNRPKYKAQEAVDLYFKNGKEIFSTSLWHKIKTADGVLDEKYPTDGIENSLNEYLGDVKLSQAIKPCLITSYDILNRRSVFFTSLDAKDEYTDFYLRVVARSTSAAPTYFEVSDAHSMFGTGYPLIDGGVFANNPAMCALVEATKLKPDLKLSEFFILSLGTGIDKKKTHSFTFEEAKNWGMARWIVPLIDILMSANSETVDYQLRKMFKNTGYTGGYIRFEPELISADPSMDNATQENMNALKQDAGQFIAENDELIDEVVNRLIS